MGKHKKVAPASKAPAKPGYENDPALRARGNVDAIQIVFRGWRNEGYLRKYAYGCCSCNQFCFSKIKKRTYLHIQENRIEQNLPVVPCICCCKAIDNVSVQYFDRGIKPKFVRVKYCTPWHCCGCFECCGGVVGNAPYECCMTFHCLPCCFCCIKWYPGLDNPDEFAIAATHAVQTFNERVAQLKRSSGPPEVQRMREY